MNRMKPTALYFGLIVCLAMFAWGCGKSESPAPEPTPGIESGQPEEPSPTPSVRPMFFKEKGFCSLAFRIDGSLIESIQKNLPETEPYAENVAAQVIKALFWDLDHRSDLRNGDTCRLVYKATRDRFKIRVYGIEYTSKKLEKQLLVFFFWEKNRKFPEYFTESGQALAKRMKNTPLQQYDEILSLFRAGRKNRRGIKFRVAISTEVYMPYPSVVEQLNWDLETDGLGVEVRYPGTGLIAQFIHLSAISSEVAPGHTIPVGSVFARTGISGDTQIPHLEYRLFKEVDGRRQAIDPFGFHGVETYSLSATSITDFVSVKHQILAKISRVGFESESGDVAATPATLTPD